MNRFIVLEGIDGSGKTFQSHRVGALLKERGFNVLQAVSPSKCTSGQAVREIVSKLGGLISGKTKADLFYADRSSSEARYKTHLDWDNTCMVLCDRFELSTHAYQLNEDDSLTFQDLKELEDRYPMDLEYMVIYFDVGLDATVLNDRMTERGGPKDHFDDIGIRFKNRVLNTYTDFVTGELKLRNVNKFVYIDAMQDEDTVTEEIMKEVLEYLS